jgi:hypothetical protein
MVEYGCSDRLDIDDLREETLDVVARTIQPSAAAVWIRGVGG